MGSDFDLPRRIFAALVSGDTEEFERLAVGLDNTANQRTNAMITAGFLVAAQEQWKPDTDVAEVRAWVADLRSGMETAHGSIDPLACENLILAALTGDADRTDDIDPSKTINLESAMAFKLVYDRKLGPDATRAYLDEVEELARQFYG